MKKLLLFLVMLLPAIVFSQVPTMVQPSDSVNRGRVIWNTNDQMLADSIAALKAREIGFGVSSYSIPIAGSSPRSLLNSPFSMITSAPYGGWITFQTTSPGILFREQDLSPFDSAYIWLSNDGNLWFRDKNAGNRKLIDLGGGGSGNVLGGGNGVVDRIAKWTDAYTLSYLPNVRYANQSFSFFGQMEPDDYTLYLINTNYDTTWIRMSGYPSVLSFHDKVTGTKTLAELAAGGTGGASSFGQLTDADTTNKQQFTTFAFDEGYSVWRQRPMIPHTVQGFYYFLASIDADSAISWLKSLRQEVDTTKAYNLKVDEKLIFPDGSYQTSAAGSSVSDDGFNSAWNGVTSISPSKNAVYDKLSNVVSNTAYGVSWNGQDTVAPSMNAVYDKIEAALFESGADGQNADSIMNNPVRPRLDTLLVEGDMLQWTGTYWDRYDPTQFIWFKDDFFTFAATGGGDGENNWYRGGTSDPTRMQANSVTAAETNHPGIQNIISTANTGIHYFTLRYQAQYEITNYEHIQSFTVIVRGNGTQTDHKVRIGVLADISDDTPNTGVYLERDAAETNWRFVTATDDPVSNTETRTDLGITYNSDWHKFQVKIAADSIRCYVDGVKKAAHVITSGPSSGDQQEIGFVINPTSAVARALYIDYFDTRMKVTR